MATRLGRFHHAESPSLETVERGRNSLRPWLGAGLDFRPAAQARIHHGVARVVLNGHDHFYERLNPQKGIAYFVVGSGGQLRKESDAIVPVALLARPPETGREVR